MEEMDNVRVNDANLGPLFCQFIIQYKVKDERLFFLIIIFKQLEMLLKYQLIGPCNWYIFFSVKSFVTKDI